MLRASASSCRTGARSPACASPPTASASSFATATAVWNPESGQSLFDFSVDEIAEKTKPIALAAVREAKAKQEDDLDADAWYELASDLELSDPAEARAAYENAIALDPTHVDAHVNLGRLLHEEGAPAAAEKHYRAALDVDPDHPVAAFNLGVALEDLGRSPTPPRRIAAPSSSIPTTPTRTTTSPASSNAAATKPAPCGI